MAKEKSRIGFDPLAWMKKGHPRREADPEKSHGPLIATRESKQVCNRESESESGKQGSSISGSIRLGDTLAIAQVRLVYRELHQALAAADRTLTLDGSAVETMDTAGVQLLAAFLRAARSRGMHVCWHETSSVLNECARQLGLLEALQLR